MIKQPRLQLDSASRRSQTRGATAGSTWEGSRERRKQRRKKKSGCHPQLSWEQNCEGRRRNRKLSQSKMSSSCSPLAATVGCLLLLLSPVLAAHDVKQASLRGMSTSELELHEFRTAWTSIPRDERLLRFASLTTAQKMTVDKVRVRDAPPGLTSTALPLHICSVSWSICSSVAEPAGAGVPVA